MFDWIISSAEHELTTAQRKHWWDFTNAKLASLTRGFPDVPRSRFLFFFCKKCKKRESGSGGRPLLVSPPAPVPPEVWRQCNMSSSSAALSPWAPSVTSRLVFQEITAQTQSDSVIWYVPRPGGNELSNLSSLSAESQNPLAHSGVLVDLNIARRGQINGQPDRISPTDLSSSYLRRRRISS